LSYAILGPRGTFSEAAARLYWGDQVDLKAVDTIEQLFTLIDRDEAKRVLIPLENSTAGLINLTIDGLAAGKFHICGEIKIAVQQHLMTARHLSLKDIELVVSQPVALLQCDQFIKNNLPGVRIEITDSTARAAQIVKNESRRAAAIGHQEASRLYGLHIIASDIQIENNYTRFIEVAKGEPTNLPGDKCSIIFTLKDRPGALYNALGIFAARNLNLSKIESKIVRDTPGNYRFYVEVDNADQVNELPSLLKQLSEHCLDIICLGTYARYMEV